MSSEKTNQSWGGRFSEPVDAFVARFTASVDFDKRLYRHDIMGSIAHATMLEQLAAYRSLRPAEAPACTILAAAPEGSFKAGLQ